MSERPLAIVTLVGFALLAVSGCASRGAGDWASVRELTPAFLIGENASDGSLAADRYGHVALTWVTGDASGQDLWLALSADSGLTFTPPVRVNPRHGSVYSRPECRPIAALGPAGELLMAWSERRADSTSVADLAIRASADGGRTLGPAVIVNDDADDGRPTFHGYASLTPLPNGDWFAVWMDSREHAHEAEMQSASLFYALSSDGGQSWSDNRLLSGRACASCRVTALADSTGLIAVAYRSVAGGMRDPTLVITRNRGLTVAADTVLAPDHWRLDMCPVDGPALTMDHAGGGHIAWHSGAGAGGTWLAPWRAETGIAGLRRSLADSLVGAGHPRLARLGEATLVTLEGSTHADSGRSVIVVRALEPDGTLTPWLLLGTDARDAAVAAAGDRAALVCWTEGAERGTRIRLVRLTPHER